MTLLSHKKVLTHTASDTVEFLYFASQPIDRSSQQEYNDTDTTEHWSLVNGCDDHEEKTQEGKYDEEQGYLERKI